MINKTTEALLCAYKKGYRVLDGKVYNKNGGLVRLKIFSKGILYYCFNVRSFDGSCHYVLVHRLVGYQKYGNKIFENGIQVRHLDSNSMNNLEDNIAIGSRRDNSMDRNISTRRRVASYAGKVYNHSEIIGLHKNGLSYKKIMEITGITSKGTISFIIKKSMESELVNGRVAQLVEQDSHKIEVAGSFPVMSTEL